MLVEELYYGRRSVVYSTVKTSACQASIKNPTSEEPGVAKIIYKIAAQAAIFIIY